MPVGKIKSSTRVIHDWTYPREIRRRQTEIVNADYKNSPSTEFFSTLLANYESLKMKKIFDIFRFNYAINFSEIFSHVPNSSQNTFFLGIYSH